MIGKKGFQVYLSVTLKLILSIIELQKKKDLRSKPRTKNQNSKVAKKKTYINLNDDCQKIIKPPLASFTPLLPLHCLGPLDFLNSSLRSYLAYFGNP